MSRRLRSFVGRSNNVGKRTVPSSQMMVFSGNANPELSAEIASYLNLPLGKAVVGQFSDGEMMTEIQENVRGRDVFVVQPTSAPTNDNLMELLVMIDALRWASAKRITAVIPYFGYARQDRRPRSARVPIGLRVLLPARKPADRSGAGSGHLLRGPACPRLLQECVEKCRPCSTGQEQSC